MKSLLLLLLLPLAGCISVRQTPLPANQAVAADYPATVAGDRKAELRLANSFRYGSGGVGRNEAESLRHWLDGAEAGNADAQMALASHYRTSDRERAAYWYLRAAEAGNRQALGALATLHGDSRNGTPDYPAALKWAYAAGNAYQINLYQKQLTPEAQADAKRQAEEWKSRQPAKEKQ